MLKYANMKPGISTDDRKIIVNFEIDLPGIDLIIAHAASDKRGWARCRAGRTARRPGLFRGDVGAGWQPSPRG